MKSRNSWIGGGAAAIALLAGLAAAQAGSLKIESWRNDDADVWNNTIIPAFNKHYPDIKVEFSPSAPADYNAAWSTDDGKTTFCVPMASVIHGFFYNEDAFKKIGATPPKTMAEFHEILDKLKKDGTFIPIDLGTADQWAAATMGFQNIGPNYWHGEQGRLALIAGKEKYSDPEYVAVFKELASWAPYMGSGFQAPKYPDSPH